jgi:hypothetical protein
MSRHPSQKPDHYSTVRAVLSTGATVSILTGNISLEVSRTHARVSIGLGDSGGFESQHAGITRCRGILFQVTTVPCSTYRKLCF